MSKSNHSQKTEHSSSYKEDEKFDEMGKSRVQKVHGGLKADAISPEELVPMNDPDCKHESMTRDPSETDFNAFICDNPNCNVVAIIEKV